MGGRPSPQRNAQSKSQTEGDGAEKEGTGQRLSNNLPHGSATELEGVTQIAPDHVGTVTEKLFGQGSGKAVLFLQHGLRCWIQRAFGGEGGARGDADEKEAQGEDGPDDRDGGK